MKKIFKQIDLPLLGLIIIFCIFGCIMVFSASSVAAVLRYRVSSNHFFLRQVLFVTVMFIIGIFVILRMPTEKYKMFCPFLLFGVIAALIGLFVYGVVSNGAQSWYNLGFFSLQPS